MTDQELRGLIIAAVDDCRLPWVRRIEGGSMTDERDDAMLGLRALAASGSLPPAPPGPRFPAVTVRLSGRDGNAVAIIGAVGDGLRCAGIDAAEWTAAAWACRSYDALLQLAMDWVTVE